MSTVAKAMTIAGSDSGGGAGIQADLKTFHQLGVYGTSAITAVTAQNTLGVAGVYPLPTEAVTQQIREVLRDIGADAAKTGMLFDAAIIRAVAEEVRAFRLEKLVVDPVMVAKGGAKLLLDEAIDALKTHLLPLAEVVTPNLPEAECLTGMTIRTPADMREGAKAIHALGARHVLMKGGHLDGEEIVDMLYDGQAFYEMAHSRIHTRHTHGTGCTFSAALTAELAKGKPLVEAVERANRFIVQAIATAPQIGGGHGPTNHWATIE
ncbi:MULTISPECIES: bifunctional hydroxymethylpyrimidine kinase/phosphomethylpyrimidine kinase [Brevibacillus]|uniref:Hydroxymethylpyrimidine/phosphomethylpyrimidine kinase n=1 Tax=Brevibacillus thermoruber TaxID=33942 RepID=A0A9X3TPS5_9BACL|nr:MULTISPECIES: bifunctional hydroxymethylpyrimidine kinase/phosphomethylpyrimidine kinase [Brevibacillus]MDA5108532.1 bifunctional hydroxymethylpyrimidine kinase/phosphomethylpyrimidine kinase [Brevibacillus thermoruber]TRY27811.1 bifunctional hydroxymethylpyrimidine kinase/phosphomethylpyrimidine kinase [Brevibacillus sp. LEMMJ03]UYZ12084.1 bifunctional hydroxymethylpyrimidine kinase/phosphomethylpyrimidine kinase [Brevibacillus sp. WF146]